MKIPKSLIIIQYEHPHIVGALEYKEEIIQLLSDQSGRMPFAGDIQEWKEVREVLAKEGRIYKVKDRAEASKLKKKLGYL